MMLALAGNGERALSDGTLADDAPQSASAETTPIVVGLSDATLTLPIPPGYCSIPPTAPDLAASFAAVEASFGKSTCLLAWFVECGALEAVRGGTAPVASLFADYGVYVTPINEAGVFQRFPGIARTAFVRQIAASMPPFDNDHLSVTTGKPQPADDDGALHLTTREIGLLGSDTQAYYLATAVELSLDGDRRALTGVAATTLVHRIAVSTIVYGGADATGALAMLEERARAASLALIQINPGGEGDDRAFSVDANRLFLIAFAVGLVFIAIGLVNLAWKWWCRRHGLQP